MPSGVQSGRVLWFWSWAWIQTWPVSVTNTVGLGKYLGFPKPQSCREDSDKTSTAMSRMFRIKLALNKCALLLL